MASLYKRKDSQYFWLKFRNAAGKKELVSTRCRKDLPNEVRRARQMAAKKSLEEFEHRASSPANSWAWVPEFFNVRYHSSPVTHERYLSAWPTLKLFLDSKKIGSPAQLLRAHCFDYVPWRQKPDKKNGKYKAGRNTALIELKILRLVMDEAVQRDLCSANPCGRLGIPKAPRKLKPDAHR